MSILIEQLQNFNRKERFVVLKYALGNDSEMISLGKSFYKNLQESLGGDPPIPNSVFLAMDYHLDWIEVALHRAKNPNISQGSPFLRPSTLINANQQDIDMLVAFDSTVNGRPLTHLVMIEAKAYTGWNNKQLRSKVNRLQDIFGDGNGHAHLEVALPRLVLMSPRVSQGIEYDYWPTWMKPYGIPQWMIYNLPRREKITRCEENGKRSTDGKHLRIDPN